MKLSLTLTILFYIIFIEVVFDKYTFIIFTEFVFGK